MQALFIYAAANLVAVGLPFAECLASRTSVLRSGSTLIHRKQAVPLNEWIAASPPLYFTWDWIESHSRKPGGLCLARRHPKPAPLLVG